MTDHATHHERRLEQLIERLPKRWRTAIDWLRQPSRRWLRITVGTLLIIGSALSILPVFGLWMLPLGVVLLAEDVPFLRRLTDRVIEWIQRGDPVYGQRREQPEKTTQVIVEFEAHVDPAEVALRLGCAVVFGLLLGLDREVRGRDAGIRTHMLVALGAAVMTMIAFEFYDVLQARHQNVAGDPLRVIGGVVTAVGFLGGGAIIRGGGEVQGLTTAANIWLCGAVGLACGAGLYVLASITLGFTVAIVTGMHMVKRWVAAEAVSKENEPPAR